MIQQNNLEAAKQRPKSALRRNHAIFSEEWEEWDTSMEELLLTVGFEDGPFSPIECDMILTGWATILRADDDDYLAEVINGLIDRNVIYIDDAGNIFATDNAIRQMKELERFINI